MPSSPWWNKPGFFPVFIILNTAAIMTYQEATDYLNNLQMHTIKLGLEAMRNVLDTLGRPDRNMRIIHVAGTNGKGSVCACLSSILQSAGYHVGLYTSPHLSSVRERFQIDGKYISQDEFAFLVDSIRQALGEKRITYFEFTTVLALQWFARRQPDLVVLETGLGGRLDATNAVSPLLSIITSISLDHQAYLGTTLTEIAGEKAGIIKQGIPVIAAGNTSEIASVLIKKSRQLDAPLYLLGRDFRQRDGGNNHWHWQGDALPVSGAMQNISCVLAGKHQRENAALVITAIKILGGMGYQITDKHCRAGLKKVTWPGRMEYVRFTADQARKFDPTLQSFPAEVLFLLDGAHNPDGVRVLAEHLADTESKRSILIWGAMKDKDVRGGLSILAPRVDHCILTMAESERSARPEQLFSCLPESAKEKAVLQADPRLAMIEAMRLAQSGSVIVVAGSLYLVGRIRCYLLGELAVNG